MVLTINNRELLRTYRQLRDSLLRGEVEEIQVPQADGKILTIQIKPERNSFGNLVAQIKKNPLQLERPTADLFDTF